MAPKISLASRSFLRFREFSQMIGSVKSMQNEIKRVVLEFMHRFEINERAVFFAENIQIMEKDDIIKLLKELAHRLEKANQNGVIEIHPTGDYTSKSAHIHWWGKYNNDVEEIITKFIIEKRLSNKLNLNYTNADIEIDFRFKDILQEYEEALLDEDSIALKNSNSKLNKELEFYDDTLEYCSEVINSIIQPSKPIDKQILDTDHNLNYQEIDMYFLELDILLQK
jgi:hypothetical protein